MVHPDHNRTVRLHFHVVFDTNKNRSPYSETVDRYIIFLKRVHQNLK